jgi:hypothetical protein
MIAIAHDPRGERKPGPKIGAEPAGPEARGVASTVHGWSA